MVEFKSWRDYYIFLKDYCNFSCLNCYYSGAGVDLSKEHTDSEYAYLFCMESISMVRLDLMSLCAKWVDEDTGKSLEEYGDAPLFKLSDDVINKLNETNKKWTIDELRALTNGNEVGKEESS